MNIPIIFKGDEITVRNTTVTKLRSALNKYNLKEGKDYKIRGEK